MLLNVYSIRDEKAQAFNVPFFMAQNGQAIRAFGDMVDDNSTTINRHPSDFTLYRIGEFDDNSGGVISLVTPEYLAKASDFVITTPIQKVVGNND